MKKNFTLPVRESEHILSQSLQDLVFMNLVHLRSVPVQTVIREGGGLEGGKGVEEDKKDE